MLPFALKVAWMVLSITGTICCWVVLSAFAQTVGSFWGPMTYCVACTLLQLVFCIGMTWRMDPYRMPKAFCIAQTLLMGFGTFLITGVSTAFSIATCITVLKPKSWGSQESRALVWRHIYALPMVVFPILASAVQIAVVLKLDAVKPSDDIQCDATDPQWVRFLGYAGTPLLLVIPCFILSIKSIVNTIRTNKHIQRSRSDELDIEQLAPMPYRLRVRRLFSFKTPPRQQLRDPVRPQEMHCM
ncbi:hypothetical protein BDZ89DRAFT_960485 [Hymenopellis radicata]|nr:hypothetical protein BDZ89DRAFT_960485 [Hymenopellis radicata]